MMLTVFIGGLHKGMYDGSDTTGIDLTLLASGKVADRLELYGALDWARNSVDNANFNFKTLHLVPGIEYRISPQVDFVTEFGIALNDDSSHYFSIGLAYYIRGR